MKPGWFSRDWERRRAKANWRNCGCRCDVAEGSRQKAPKSLIGQSFAPSLRPRENGADTVVTRADRWGLWTEKGWLLRLACVQGRTGRGVVPRPKECPGDYRRACEDKFAKRISKRKLFPLDLALRTTMMNMGRWAALTWHFKPGHLAEALVASILWASV